MRARRLWAPVVAVAAICAVAASVFLVGVASAGVLPVSIGSVRPESPAVSGGRLVWADRRASHYDVYEYDAVTHSTLRLTTDAADHIQPAIRGDLVVWADYRHGDADIYGYDVSTGTERPLVVAFGDQIAPSVSGRWLVWQDMSSGYSGSVKALDLTNPGSSVISVASYARRPRVAGDLVVWEDTSKALALDVRAMNLATSARYDVATSAVGEQLPATDGRYVAWASDNGTDLDVKCFDTQTSRYFTCAASAGEQSFPEVGNGVVYWIDNVPGQRLHVDTYDIASGRTARFNDYGTEDVSAVSASSGDIAWLAKAGQAWQLRATFGAGAIVTSALSRLVPASVPTVRLAQLSADPTAPEVVSASISGGALNVPRSSSFSVYFSKALDPSSVTAKTVRVLDGRGRTVRSRVRYSALAKSVTVTPASPLGAGTYTLAVSPSVSDPSGNTISDPLTISFSTIEVLADTTPPGQPGAPVAQVYQGNQIKLTWNAAADDVGVNGYLVYRSLSATPVVNFPADASLVTSTSTTNVTFPATSAETTQSFTWFYVVVARDSAMNVSPPSLNASPDPHGGFMSRTSLCTRCHYVHGNAPALALGAKSASACYACHGNTPTTSAYGAASSMDAQSDFRDDTVISSGGPEVSGRGSIHRNAYMATIQRECDGCHGPHRRPYDSSSPANGFNRLLRTQLSTNPAGFRYNTDASAVGNQFCADCHGSSATNIAIIGGATAYSETAGNHLTNYASSAHATASVPVNAGDTNPSIQCEACHNNHASSTNKLIDYRGSNTTLTANNQSGLCFKCHSASGAEAGKPNTWNGRDVKVEFARTSHHPYTVPIGAPPMLSGNWSQTSQADFQMDQLNNLTAIATPDSVQLASQGGLPGTLWTDGFENGDLAAWDSGSGSAGYWAADATSKRSGSYGGHGIETGTSQKVDYLTKTIDLTGRTNPQLSYYYSTISLGGSDSFAVDYSTNGGGSWTNLFTTSANVGWTAKTHALPTNANRIRFTTNLGTNTSRNIYLDDVAVTADAVAGGFVASGDALSTLVFPQSGSILNWTNLTLNGTEPAGTTMTVQVLDGSNSAVLQTVQFTAPQTAVPLVIDPILHPTLLLKASMTGNVQAPRVFSDTFGGSSLDTAKWTDNLVGGVSDPDAGATGQSIANITFASNIVGSTGMDSQTPATNNQWYRNTNTGSDGSAGYARIPNGGTCTDHVITKNLGDLSAYSAVNLSYSYYRNTITAGTSMTVEWSTNGGTTWTALRTHNSTTNNPTSWTPYTNNALAVGTNCMLRFRATVVNNGDSMRLDTVTLTGDRAGTNMWPAMGGGYLTLKAAGTDIGGTGDQCEFVSMNQTWFAGDFDIRSNVTSITDSNPGGSGQLLKAGIMIRTGATTATAVANNAAFAGMFVTSGANNGAMFEYRATVGGTAVTANSASLVAAPQWVRLARRGNVITGYQSDDGVSWVQVGQGSVANGGVMLAGVALSSHINATTFSMASFDHYTATEAGLMASLTPRLDDWALAYTYQLPPGGWQDAVDQAWAQTTQTDFNADNRSQTAIDTADGDGEIVLGTTTVTFNPPRDVLLFAHNGLSTSFDQFAQGTRLWNSMNFNPPDYNNSGSTTYPGSGSSSFVLGTDLYTTQAGGGTGQWWYQVPDGGGLGSWSTTTALPYGPSTGGDAAVNTRTADTCVYYIRGGGNGSSSPGLMCWNYANNSTTSFYFNNGSNRNLGAGAAIAFAPAANRLFLINRNGNSSTSNDGVLYYRSTPGRPADNNQTAWTAGPQVVQSGTTTYYNRMTRADVGGSEYLFILGRSASYNATGDLEVVSTLGGTPTVISTQLFPWNSALADGCDLEWDGGAGNPPNGYLYAIRGSGTSGGFARIAIPNNPGVLASWAGSAWEQLPSAPWGTTFNAGSSIAFAQPDVASYTGPGYYNNGTVTTGDIKPAAGGVRWGTMSFGSDTPDSTDASVTVQGWDGSQWVKLLTTNAGSADLSGYSTSAYSKLRLIGSLYTPDPNYSPDITDWAVTSIHQTWTSLGTLTCVNCHNAHTVQKGSGGWVAARVNDPANTKTVWAGSFTDFCLSCHNMDAGQSKGTTMGVSAIVPYAVSFHTLTGAPYFYGFSKMTVGFDYKTSGHYTTTSTAQVDCENCHDPHASNNKRLTAWTKPAVWTGGIAATRDNTSAASAESNLCFNCHGNSGVSIGGFAGRTATAPAGINMDIATPLNGLRAHPTAVTGAHSDLETTANLGVGNRHAECADCHDPHAAKRSVHATGQSEAGGVLRGAWGVNPAWGNTGQMTAPTAYTNVRVDGTTTFESSLCFKCHSSNVNLSGVKSPSGGFQETNIAAEFNPNNMSGHNVAGDAFTRQVTGPSGWTWFKPTTASLGLNSAVWNQDSEMTCSDCHAYSGSGARGPHGSANTFLMKYGSGATTWWSTSLNSWSSASNMCNKCHTSDPHGSWEGEDSAHRTACEACHIRIPHGWKRPRMLAYHNSPTTDNLPYVDPAVRGNTGVRNSQTDNNLGKDDCLTNCGEHNNGTGGW